MWRPRRAALALALLAGLVATVLWVFATRDDEAPAELIQQVEASPVEAESSEPVYDDDREVSEKERAALIRRAQVWRAPRTPISRASFANLNLDALECKFKVTEVGGTTPKFDCEVENGEEVRIKYGNGPEIPAETAATRLLSALGFGADRVTIVQRVRCYGCPEEPFSTLKALELTRSDALYKRVVDHSEYEDFEWVVLERKFNARPIETDQLEGWSFFELDTIKEAEGGAPRAHVDGLRLLAVLLAHWDNKAENQRLVCLAAEWPKDTDCPSPFLLLQDVGATFGPTKMDFQEWQKTAMWDHRAGCVVSMRSMPFEGATFGQATVSEKGRRFLADLLNQLSDDQLTDLFEGARFGDKRGVFNPVAPVADWVRVFKEKRQAISDGPPCPQ